MSKNCIFISPNYPEGHWRYVEALKQAGYCVLGIGDAGEETFPPSLRYNLDDYYRVCDLHDYAEVRRAAAYMLWKHGSVDRVETVNGYWNDLVGALRMDFARVGADPAECFAADSALLSSLPDNMSARADSAAQALAAAEALGYPLIASRLDRKTGERISISDADSLSSLEFSGGESYLLTPVGYVGGADAFCCDGKVLALSLYSFEADALVGLPLSAEQQRRFSETALMLVGQNTALVHINAKPCEAGVRGVIRKGELVPAGGRLEPEHEYSLELLSAEHDCDIRALWAQAQTGLPDSPLRTLERKTLAAAAFRHGGAAYRRYHEQVLRRLAPRLAFHSVVAERDRERFGDYVYVVTGLSTTELRRDIRFITELIPEPKAEASPELKTEPESKTKATPKSKPKSTPKQPPRK